MSDAPTFDLQSHSTCSDGELEPAGVVERAGAAGVELLALSDHDTLEGTVEALTAGRAQGLRVVPAVEISTVARDGDDLHILGYMVDHENARLLEVLRASRADRQARARRMIERLGELGFAVDERELEARARAGRSIGRPHIAEAVVVEEANAERLRDEGIREPGAFLAAYLIAGRPAFVARAAPSVAGAIELIHGAGGVAVWAHPFWDIEDEDAVIASLERFAAGGLDGVEAFYVTHTAHQTSLLHERARELDLLITGSSDFHGPSHSRFSRFRAFELHGLAPVLGALAQA